MENSLSRVRLDRTHSPAWLRTVSTIGSTVLIPARGLLELVAPPNCLVCGRTLRAGKVCSRCVPSRSSIGSRCAQCDCAVVRLDDQATCELCRLFPTQFGAIRSLWDYSGRAKELITAMKYRPSMALASECGRMLRDAMPELFGIRSWEAIVPIPSSRQSLRHRGFNQCDVIARALSTFAPSRPGLLRHRGYRSVQASLSHERRLANVRRAFGTPPNRSMPGRILLVDDVMTTGSTASAAAATLLEAGAVTVDLVCLARSPSWSDHRHELHRAWPGRIRILSPSFRKGTAADITSACYRSPQRKSSPSSYA